jgi:hypothetical protein
VESSGSVASFLVRGGVRRVFDLDNIEPITTELLAHRLYLKKGTKNRRIDEPPHNKVWLSQVRQQQF